MHDREKDAYPSRQSASPSVMPRIDPVVYSDWSPSAPLSRQDADIYAENGFLLLTNVFGPDEVSMLRQEAGRLSNDPASLEPETTIAEPGSGAVRSVFKAHTQSALFSRLSADARLARVAQFLLDDDVYIHQSRLNYKPGFAGKEFYWHSDFETWHVEDGMPRMRAVSMSVLLTDNTTVNSPTMFFNGSHQHFVACVGETPDDHYKESLKKQEYGVPDGETLARFAREKGISMPTGPAGAVVLFDCNTIHGSNSNITPLPRSNAFIVYNAVSNKLVAPFGAEKPRPEFIGARRDTPVVTPVEGRLLKAAA